MLMKIKFQSLTEKGRWLLATLTLIFTLGIGQMWGAPTDMEYAYTYSSGAVVTGPTTDDFFTPSAPTFTGANYEAKSNSSRLRYTTKTAGAEATVSFQFTAKDALKISAITMNNCANSDKIKAVKIRYRINSGSWSTDQATTVPKSDLGDTEVTLPSAGIELDEDDVLTIQVDLKNTDTGTSGRAWDINTITIATEAAGGSGDTPTTPAITNPASDPDLETITQGETKTFTVTATGYPSPTLKWYKNTSKSTTGATEIEGATAASYTTPNTLAASTDNYYFYCVATNSQGTAQSPYFSLKVNPLGGDLTAHTPGVYTKAQASGGYGAELITVSERDYETYYIYNNSGLYLTAGNIARGSSGAYEVITKKNATDGTAKADWVAIKANGITTSITPNTQQFNTNKSTAYVKLRNKGTETIRLKVSGYDQFAFYGANNSSSDATKQFTITIDGVAKTNPYASSNSNAIFSFDITTSEHYIEISVGGNTSSDSKFYAFSLRLPELPDADKFNVGVEDNSPCVAGGESATITLSGSQSGVSYQLYKDAEAVDGKVVAGTGSAISFAGIEVAGTYTVKSVANASYKETAMTGSAVVTLAESPVITTQPTASQKVAVSSAISLSVESSTDGVSYQWYSMTDPAGPAVIIDGKDEATLEITSAATATTMYYYCLISKSGMCSVASDLAEVITKTGCETETLATSTNINNSSDNHTGCTTTINLSGQKLGDGKYYEMSLNGGFKAGDIVTVNVKANDYESGKLYMVYGTHSSYSGYQVQNGPEEGNTADVEFVIPSDMTTIGFIRTTTTTDGDKTQNHEIKSVTVERETCYCVKPTIGTQPADAAICSGLTTILSVADITGGTAPYTYAWYNADGTAVSGGSGANTASYTTAALDADASYYCVVSNADGCSVQSNTVAVTVKAATAITTQPVDADASIGIAREFSIVATGAGTLTYQWQTQVGENWENIANADEATYSVSKDAAGDYKFRCIVGGDCGDDVISNVVTLSVSADVLTVTYNANGGTCETASATWTEGDDALILPAATKENFDFVGWYDAVTGGNKIASPYTPSASIELFAHYMPKLVQAIYSNTFDAFIKNQAVTVYYMEGESAPTLSSIKVLGQDAPVYEEADGNIKVTIETVDYIFPVTKTAVAPYTGTGSKETFDGNETYVKTGNAFSTDTSKEGWKFSKTDNDWSREADGRTRLYFFLGAAQEVAFENGGTARDIKVYRNGTLLDEPTSSGNAVIAGTNTPAMYAIVSNQGNGDGALKSMTFTPWVPVTGITLKEGSTAITSKEVAQGAQFTLTAEVTPANASNPAIVWESENASIASVDGGVVTGEATGGPVNIIARSQDNNTIYAACAVTVAAPCTPATVAWDVEPADGIKGHNGSASVTTNYAAGLEVVSSDPTVASVSNDGVNITINYLKKGSAKITATVVGDGSIYCNTPASVEKTITVSPDCPVSGNLFTWAYDPEATDITYNLTKTTSTEDNDVEVVTAANVVTVSGGQAYLGTTSSSSTATVTDGALAFRLNGNNYAKIVLECPLQVGDKISYTANNTREHAFYKDEVSGDAVSSVNKQVVINSTTHKLYGAEVLYVKGSNTDSHFKTFSIDRLAPVAGVSLENATIAIGNTVTPTMTLLPSNEAYYESIAWSIVGEGAGTIANINATTGAVTALAAGTVTVQVKLNNSESLKATCQVEVVASFEQVDVTESTVWDMNNVSASAIELPEEKRNGLLLANVNGVNNNASFNSQALYFEGQHIGRISSGVKHLAGRKVQFNVTVPGAVLVTFASNGSNQRTVAINGKKCARTTNDATYITYALAVEPGSVEIVGYQGTSANQYVRISKIEFKAEDNYHRTVNPSFLGTLCWTNNAVLGGATLYEFQGKNENNYLVFDEVAENRLEAGKPYIFMPENGNTQIKLYNTDDAEPLTTNQDPVKHMYGTLVDTDLYPTTDEDMYYFSSNHIWAVKDFTGVEKITIPAYYCYIDYPAVLDDEPAAAPAPGRRRVTMGVQGEQVVTGINAIEASEKPMKLLINGQIFILRGEKLFDATGRLVK